MTRTKKIARAALFTLAVSATAFGAFVLNSGIAHADARGPETWRGTGCCGNSGNAG